MRTLNKIKTHVRENRNAYIVGGIGITIGSLATAVVMTKAPGVKIDPKIQQILSWKPTATLEVHIEALGDPGNIIQDTTTGTIYASQGQAARELGLSAPRISEQLNGARDHVNGHKFTNLGKAFSSQ